MSSIHIVPVKTYILVFVTLLVFTGLTAGIAFIDLGPFNALVAIIIAAFKSSLVILFFMHVKYSQRMTKVAIVGGLFFLLILLTLSMTDYISRPWNGASSGRYGELPANTK